MSLPALSPNADIRSIVERINRLAQEFNRTERKAAIIGTDTGTATAYAITPTPGIALYEVGQVFNFQATHANSGTAPTLNVNGKGAGTITYPDGSALVAGDIALNATVTVAVASATPTFHLLQGPVATFIRSSLLTTRGDMIRRGASAPERFALGASGTVLSSNGTDAVWAGLLLRQIVKTESGVVATGTTAIPWDDTIPQNTEGDEYLTRAITPQSATSTLLIDVVFNYAVSTADTCAMALFQDATAGALAAVAGLASNVSGTPGFNGQMILRHAMTSGTTSATTFKVRAGPTSGTMTFNGAAAARKLGGVMASSITVMEFGA